MSPRLKALLHLLGDGALHSAEQLSEQLKSPFFEIEPLLQQLIAWDVCSDTPLGFQLLEPLTLLDKARIEPYLDPLLYSTLGSLELLTSVTSTNDYLFQHYARLSEKNHVCFAERQTQGKGRQGRTWISPFGKNIALSMLWRFKDTDPSLEGLGLSIGVSVVEAFHQMGIPRSLGIKWPNDIFFKYQKLGGILVEQQRGLQGPIVVIGIGLNVHMPFQADYGISKPWIDLQSLSPQALDRNQIAGRILNQVLKGLQLYQQEGLAAFLARWTEYDLTLNHPVKILTPQKTVQGIGKGITPEGHFLLEGPDGDIQRFASGEVSLQLDKR